MGGVPRYNPKGQPRTVALLFSASVRIRFLPCHFILVGQIFIVRERTVDGLDNMIVKQYSTVGISPMRSWREETMTLEAETKQPASVRSCRRRRRAALYIEEGILLQPDILPRIARFLGVDSPDDGGFRLCTNNTAGMSIFLNFLQSRECLLSCQVAAVFLPRDKLDIDMEVLGNPAIITIPWKMFVLAEKVTGNSNKDFVLIDSSEIRQGKTGLMPAPCETRGKNGHSIHFRDAFVSRR